MLAVVCLSGNAAHSTDDVLVYVHDSVASALVLTML